MYTVHPGRRYRLRFRNESDDLHPLHLHWHSFELTRVGGKPTAGVVKDVVMLGGFQEVEFDFVADNPGLTLLHCHQQLHMDFGFMALFNLCSQGHAALATTRRGHGGSMIHVAPEPVAEQKRE
jgi:FtsP/CotA-like multicopper oxidase with cupredoxin domain